MNINFRFGAMAMKIITRVSLPSSIFHMPYREKE